MHIHKQRANRMAINGFNVELESEPVPTGLLLFLPLREASFCLSTYCILFSLSVTQWAEGYANLKSVHTHMYPRLTHMFITFT